MGELVRRDESEPAVVVLQPGVGRRRREEQVDAVRRKHQRRTVRGVDVVDQREVDHLARRLELGRQQPVGALGLPSSNLRHVAVDRAEMNAEVGGVQGAPAAGGVNLRFSSPGQHEEHQNADCGLRIAEYQ